MKALEIYVPTSTPQDTSGDRDTSVLQNEVRLADERLLVEETWRKKWEETPISGLEKRIADRDIFLTRFIQVLKEDRVWKSSLQVSRSFEDFKERLKEGLERLRAEGFAVQTTAQAIRDSREEFSNSNGLPEGGWK